MEDNKQHTYDKYKKMNSYWVLYTRREDIVVDFVTVFPDPNTGTLFMADMQYKEGFSALLAERKADSRESLIKELNDEFHLVRERMIREEAYYIAERSGFEESPETYWFEAKKVLSF